jgi:dihydrofolate reductase
MGSCRPWARRRKIRLGASSSGAGPRRIWDDVIGAALAETFSDSFDLVLGRRTYDIFAAHWPYVEFDPNKGTFDAVSSKVAETFNAATKYVATHSPETLSWQNSEWLGENVAETLRNLKRQDGPALLVQGSSRLIQTLLSNDLIDELRLLIYPLVLGTGKRLFGDGTTPAAFKLTKSAVSPNAC